MRLADLAKIEPVSVVHETWRRMPEGPDDYRQLACLLVDRWLARRHRLVGIGGGQGAGKSTLGRLVIAAGELRNCRVEVLSLDDFYLTRDARQALGRNVHPLLETRGPPGTHEVGLLDAALDALARPGRVEVPRFDKAIDDRVASIATSAPVDLVVLEGWCVGAPPRPDGESLLALNTLERDEDAEGQWREFIERSLIEYQRLFERLEDLVFLKVPGLDAVRRWRLQQEQERPHRHRLSANDVRRFVEHYERITRRMLKELPRTAGVTVDLADDHSVSGLTFR